MTISQKRKLKRLLPTEIRQQIADDLGISYSYVNMVLHGTRNNMKVIEQALFQAELVKKRNIKLSKRAAQL